MRIEGLTQIDLENTTLSELLDDARSFSLFSTKRVIWVSSAELALPRRLSAAEEGEETGNSKEAELAAYLKLPTPGTVIVFECSRYEFSGDDKSKMERVEKFYTAIPPTERVEFRQLTPESLRFLAQDLAKKQKLRLPNPELAVLIEAVAGDANRLAAEIEKLSLFVGSERDVAVDDLRGLVPNTAESTIFALVSALGRRDRASALRSLDILVQEGEYLPLALVFLSTQFRLALAAKEAKILSPQQALPFFAKIGVRMLRDRAEQVITTARTFTREHLSRALAMIYETDRKFRDGYKDERIVMESLVLALTQ